MNKTFTEAISTAEKYTTKKEKHNALSGLTGDHLTLIWEALNPYRVFNVKKWESPKAFASVDPDDFSKFLELLNLLHNRTITGNAAKAAVTAILGLYTEKTSHYLERVLRKDLKCGADKKTFEDIYPFLNIPEFLQGLAAKIDDSGKYKWEFPCIAEAKYDGMRLIAFIENGEIEYFSRGGKTADYVVGLFDEELIQLGKTFRRPLVVDGEAYARNFQETTQARGVKNEEARSYLKYNIFDIMTKEEWVNQSCSMKQKDRMELIYSLFKVNSFKKISLSHAKVVYSVQEAMDFYASLEDMGKETGIDLSEGLIIKKVNGLYDWDPKRKSMVWAKYKPVLDFDVKIVDFLPGNKDTKNENILGALVIEGEDENGNKIKCKCGAFKIKSPKAKDYVKNLARSVGIDLTKISEDEFIRTYIWNNKEKFRNKVAMIEGQMLSKAKDSDHYAIRFPQFICIRNDKE